jgi:hypothetical protein
MACSNETTIPRQIGKLCAEGLFQLSRNFKRRIADLADKLV